MKPLYHFPVSVTREVEETTTRVEEGKTISETKKISKKVLIPFMFKMPSRAEKELIEEERAVWETHYITRGILPTALLLKTFANHGGLLSEDQKAAYMKTLAELRQTEETLHLLLVHDKDNKEALDKTRTREIELRQSIIEFQQDQAMFFNNTAEAMARKKVIEWLVMNMTYYKPRGYAEGEKDEGHLWEPFFKGDTLVDKLDFYDQLIEKEDELLAKCYDRITFFATLYASSDELPPKEHIDEFMKGFDAPESVQA